MTLSHVLVIFGYLFENMPEYRNQVLSVICECMAMDFMPPRGEPLLIDLHHAFPNRSFLRHKQFAENPSIVS
jgi:hypothetical protein